MERGRTEQERPVVTLEGMADIGLIKNGDNIGEILSASLIKNGMELRNQDIIVIAQKIISKAEGRITNLSLYTPSDEALKISEKSGRDPRLVQLIINENRDIRFVGSGTSDKPGLIVGKHKLGHVCSGAGIDIDNSGSADKDDVLLLPIDPDASAKKIAELLESRNNKRLGIIIIDTMGDGHRTGSIGKAIGIANVPARAWEYETFDLDGKKTVTSDLALADSIGALAMVMMGTANLGVPAILVRGINFEYSPDAKTSDIYL